MSNENTLQASPTPISPSANEPVGRMRETSFQPGQVARLVDQHDRFLGEIRVDSVEKSLVLGTVTPTAEYVAVEALFEEHTACVNELALSVAGELEEKIAALGLRLTALDGAALPSVHDIQIGGRYFSCRIR
jgi:hypothetical protein